jgi:DNA-binding Lrp family transcriptional regulator
VERGVLKRQFFFNVFRLGYAECSVFCTLSNASQKNMRKFIDYCVSSERVSYLCELSGSFQFNMNFTTRGNEDSLTFLNQLEQELKGPFLTKKIAHPLRLYEFGSKELHHKVSMNWVMHFGDSESIVTIDELDHQVLRFLAESPNASPSEIGRRLGVPGTTVTYRIERLATRGVITGCRYLTDTDGQFLKTYRILVYCSGGSSGARDALFKFCCAHPAVTYFIDILGEWNFELGVRTTDQGDVASLNRTILDQFAGFVVRGETLCAHDLLKLNKYPFRKMPAFKA